MKFQHTRNIFNFLSAWNEILNVGANKPTQAWRYYLALTFCYYAQNLNRLRRHPIVFHRVQDATQSAILPLVVSSRAKMLEGIANYRRLDHEDVISSSKDAVFIKEAICSVFQAYPGYNVKMCNVNEDSMLYSVLGSLMIPQEPCVKIPLPPTHEEYIASLSKHQRQNIRTAYNKLQKEGISFSLSAYDRQNPLSRKEWHMCEDIYELRHNEEEDGFSKWKNRHMNAYHYILQNVEERLTFVLYCNNTLYAYMSGMYSEQHKCYYVPRLCINPEYARYSPGIIFVNEVAKLLIQRGSKTLDLMLGDEPYKLAMGGVVTMNYSLDTIVERILEVCTHQQK